ncbi:hypothetical protein EMIT0P218_110054 [Pseudomonas sp. IT-P218]
MLSGFSRASSLLQKPTVLNRNEDRVGASLLAMEVNDDAGSLAPRGALRFFASRLAPTEMASSKFPANT